MSGFGMFEANVTSDAEEKRQMREAANKLAAATYDVRERFGQFLFGSKDLAEYTDRLALSKNDILKTIEPHVFPRTGTVRRVLKPLEDEFKSRQSRTASRRTAAPKPSVGDEGSTPMLSPSGGREPGYGGASGKDADTNYTYPESTTPASLSNRGQFAPNSSPAASAAASPGGDGGADGSGWSPNNATDSIGAGNYNIQSGDTLTTIGERAGVSVDDLMKGNSQITDPDMIIAGDSLNIPGSSSSSTSTTSTSPGLDTTAPPSTPSTPLAAEAGGPAPTSGTPGVPPVPSVGVPGDLAALTSDPNRVGRRAASRRRYAEFDGTLEPEGDFKGYLSDVDEGDEGRTTNNFGGTFPGGTDHNGDPAKTDFVKDSTRRFALWCRANRRLASLDALEAYAPSDREYVAIAATLQRVAASGVPGSTPTGPEWNSKGKPKLNKPTKPGKMDMPELPGIGAPMGSMPGNKSAGKHDSPWDGDGFLGRDSEGVKSRTDMAYPPELVQGDPAYPNEPPMMKRVKGQPGKHRAPEHRARRRTAAPDYLQKADEALTNLLNQKAEEFQGQIAPLQQALQTVQQAEQAAQAANPMGVMPPAGTVNVMPEAPGGDPSGGGGMDPSALAAMMGGGDPSAGGGDPMMSGDPNAMGGGAPPGLNPAAMGGAPPAAQDQGLPPMMARRRRQAKEYDSEGLLTDEGLRDWSKKLQHEDDDEHAKKEARRRFARLHQAKDCKCWDGYCRVPGTKPCADGSCEKCDTSKKESRRRRQAKNVDEMWEEFSQNATRRGGEPDVDAFAQRYKVGPIALKRIRQKMSADDRKRGGQGKGRRASAHTSTRRQAWSGWGSASMKRVAGWDFDHRLNGYITAAADTFSCDCGENFSTPSGYRKCGSCGRAWNSYVIGTDSHGKEASLEKVICREIPVRKDVIVASKRTADPNGQYDPDWNAPKWRFSGEPGDYGYSDEKQQQAWESALQEHGYEHKPMSRYGPSHSSWVHPKNEQRVPAYPWDGWSPGQPFVSPKPDARTPQTFGEPWMNYTMFKESNRRTADIYCNGDGCNNIKAPPAEDWSRSKGIPFDMNTKHQYYFESGGDHPKNYDEDFEIPAHWDSFGSWGGSGFCADCHPYKDKHPHPEAPGYNEWLQQNKSHPGKLPLRQDWDRGDPNDPRIKGSSRKADKHTLRRIDLRDMMDQEPQEDKPDIEHFAARRAAAITYVARCQRAGRRPTPHGLRRFMGSQQLKSQSLYDHYMNDTGPNYPGKTVVDFTDPQWQTKTNWDGSRYDADGSPVFPFVPHSDRVRGKPYFISPHPSHPTGWYKSQDYTEHRQTCPTCSSGKRHASRRRAEHFDITEEGGTPKGTGKPSKKTTMSTPDAQWHRRNRGGRYT